MPHPDTNHRGTKNVPTALGRSEGGGEGWGARVRDEGKGDGKGDGKGNDPAPAFPLELTRFNGAKSAKKRPKSAF